MNILVTGGAGFIGSHIVDALIEEGNSVAVVDKLITGSVEHVNPLSIFYPIDILDETLDAAFAMFKPDVVIHHAAQIDVHASMHKPKFDSEINIVGTLNVLEKCIAHSVRKIIYASSAAVYGTPDSLGIREDHPIRPLNGYGISKYTPELYIELFAQLHALDYTIFRYANVYGERQSSNGEAGVVSIFIDRLLQGQAPQIYGDGEQTRDFVYVKDVVRANVMALSQGSRAVLNIGTNTATSIRQLFEHLRSMTNTQLPAVMKEDRPGDIRHSRLDYSRAAELLGWQPIIGLVDGLASTVQGRLQEQQRREAARNYHAL